MPYDQNVFIIADDDPLNSFHMQTSDQLTVAQTLLDLKGLVDNLLLLLSDKEKIVIKRRFDLDGKGKATLEEIGQEFSVTRERIRQIEKNALSKMKRNVFNTTLRGLHDFVLTIVREHGGLVRKKLLVNNLVSILPDKTKINPGSLDLSLFLHEDLDCIGNTINFFPYAKLKNIPDYSLKHASNNLINQMHKYGDVKSLDKLNVDLKHVFDEIGFDLAKIKSLIVIDKRIALLENDLVGLLEWRHIHPRTLRDKILFVLRNSKHPVHFMDIAKQIESENFDNRRINLQAVHNELIRHDQFVLIGRGIYALSEWGYEKGTVADVIEMILGENKELSQEEIIDKVLEKRQVKRITIILALKNGKKFSRVGRKHYKLKAKA